MRLRSFTASTITQAMRMVRDELGDDAIIVSTHGGELGRPARVTAVVEPPEEAEIDAQIEARVDPPRAPSDRAWQVVRDAFERHGVPASLARRLSSLAGDALDAAGSGNDPTLALAAALGHRFRFAPLTERTPSRPILLVGPCGAGKTATIAKLAARAIMAGRRVRIVTTDTVRAGGIEQLSTYTRLLRLELQVAEDNGALADAVLAAASLDGVLIDSPGTNPFDDAELEALGATVAAIGAEAVLVLPAGLDPGEAAETAAAFARIGARRLVVTRLDAARRFGSLPAAADAGGLALADIGVAPQIADGLRPLNPVALARLMLRGLAQGEAAQPSLEAAS